MRLVATCSDDSRGPISPRTFHKVLKSIDDSTFLRLLDEWHAERANGKGGRPAQVSIRAYMAGMALTVVDERAPTLNEVTGTLFCRLSDAQRAELGIRNLLIGPKGLPDRQDFNRAYANVLAAHQRIFLLLEPHPFLKGRRVSRARWELHLRYDNPVEVAQRRERLFFVANAILDAGISAMSRHARRAFRRYWGGSVALDGTSIQHHSRRIPTSDPRGWIDPQIGWHVRPNQAPFLGYEITIARAIPDDPDGRRRHPMLPVAMTIHTPARAPGLHGGLALHSLKERGYPTKGWLTTDQLFQPGSRSFHKHLRSFDYTSVFSYGLKSAGRQATHEGAILIDGHWYCPAIPKEYINATVRRREGKITLKRYRDILKARSKYRLRPDRRSADGTSTAFICPAAGPAPMMVCPNKPRPASVTIRSRRNPLPSVAKPPAMPPKVCTNVRSLSIPDHKFDRYYQKLEFGSEEWAKVYGMRSMIEGLNGNAKDTTRNALGVKGRIRCSGISSTALAVAWTLYTLILRYGRNWDERAVPDEHGIDHLPPEKVPKKRLPFDPATDEVLEGEEAAARVHEAIERLASAKSPP